MKNRFKTSEDIDFFLPLEEKARLSEVWKLWSGEQKPKKLPLKWFPVGREQ